MTPVLSAMAIGLACGLLHLSTLPAASADATRVNIANFARAETDMYMARAIKQNGLGKMGHERTPAPIDDQKVVRMNRDTLYSSAVFDLDAGPVTITLPPGTDKRFMSMLAISEDHYTNSVYYSGAHTYSRKEVGTRYLFIILRTLINPEDPKDIAAAHALQDAVTVRQASVGTFDIPNWDKETQDKTREALIALASLGGTDEAHKFGTKKDVEPISHLIYSAAGWGGNPREAAAYYAAFPQRNDGTTIYKMTVKDVPVDGFWSLSVYNDKGYFEKNDVGAYSVNNLTATKDARGAATIQFGGCTKGAPNCLPIVKGWNYTLRLYRPRKAVLDGTWKAPEAMPAN